MKDFNREKVEKLVVTKDTLVIRTSELLPTLQHMQECGRRLWELLPDDEGEFEYNVLTFYKPRND